MARRAALLPQLSCPHTALSFPESCAHSRVQSDGILRGTAGEDRNAYTNWMLGVIAVLYSCTSKGCCQFKKITT